MSKSLPTKEIYSIDIPDPYDLEVTFDYNFFTPSEGLQETGGISEKFLSTPSEERGIDFIQYVTTRAPRFNVIEWSVPKYVKQLITTEKLDQKSTPKGLITNNLSKIVSENDLSSYDYFSFLLNDPELNEKLFNFVSGSLLNLVDDDDDDDSHARAAMKLKAKLPSTISAGFLNASLNQPKLSFGGSFKDTNGKTLDSDRWTALTTIATLMQVNSKLAKGMITRAINDPHSPYTEELQGLLKTSTKLFSYVQQKQVNSVNEGDFQAVVPYINVTAAGSTTTSMGSIKMVGFIIDKIEHLSDGRVKNHDQIVVESADIKKTVDFRVKYGSTYSYIVRSVALVTMPAIDIESDRVSTISFLVSSRSSNMSTVNCIETVAPPVPSDLDVAWNYETERLMIHWTFPPNSQRDIKEFQVFRRPTTNDPFELIKSYRFNDALVQNELTIHHQESYVDSSLIEEIDGPVTFYEDYDFNKSSKFIYTVVCVDAHGMTSNYGMQFEVSFDIFKNKLVKTLISHSGAPKPYPNLYLEADTFVDTIRVSGPHSKRLKVYLNPETYTVTDSSGREKSVLATAQEGGSYRLQFINTDSQMMATAIINIDDRRTPPKRSRVKKLRLLK